MNKDAFADVSKQAEAFFAPVQKLNELSLSSFEKLAKIQMAAMNSYVDFGLKQLKASVEVKDAAGLQAFVTGQADAMKVLGEKVVADSKAVAELSGDVTTKARKIGEESVAALKLKAA